MRARANSTGSNSNVSLSGTTINEQDGAAGSSTQHTAHNHSASVLSSFQQPSRDGSRTPPAGRNANLSGSSATTGQAGASASSSSKNAPTAEEIQKFQVELGKATRQLKQASPQSSDDELKQLAFLSLSGVAPFSEIEEGLQFGMQPADLLNLYQQFSQVSGGLNIITFLGNG